MCACVYVDAYTCVYGWRLDIVVSFLPQLLSPLFFETGSPMEPEAHGFYKTGCPASPRIKGIIPPGFLVWEQEDPTEVPILA